MKQNDSKIHLEKQRAKNRKRRQERRKRRMRRINMKREGRNIKVGNCLPENQNIIKPQ